jgi:hypothetical protein
MVTVAGEELSVVMYLLILGTGSKRRSRVKAETIHGKPIWAFMALLPVKPGGAAWPVGTKGKAMIIVVGRHCVVGGYGGGRPLALSVSMIHLNVCVLELSCVHVLFSRKKGTIGKHRRRSVDV